jgi:hypothetical protein
LPIIDRATAATLFGAVRAALDTLPSAVRAELRRAASRVRVLDACLGGAGAWPAAWFDPKARALVFAGPRCAHLPLRTVTALVAHAVAHAVLWVRGREDGGGGATERLVASWGYDPAALDGWGGAVRVAGRNRASAGAGEPLAAPRAKLPEAAGQRGQSTAPEGGQALAAKEGSPGRPPRIPQRLRSVNGPGSAAGGAERRA